MIQAVPKQTVSTHSSARLTKPQFAAATQPSPDAVTLTVDPDTLRQEGFEYEYGKVYSLEGKLSPLQWAESLLIWTYQGLTRNLFKAADWMLQQPWMALLLKTVFKDDKDINTLKAQLPDLKAHGICAKPFEGLLSCSEYTLLACHFLGGAEGWEKGFMTRTMHCNKTAASPQHRDEIWSRDISLARYEKLKDRLPSWVKVSNLPAALAQENPTATRFKTQSSEVSKTNRHAA